MYTDAKGKQWTTRPPQDYGRPTNIQGGTRMVNDAQAKTLQDPYGTYAEQGQTREGFSEMMNERKFEAHGAREAEKMKYDLAAAKATDPYKLQKGMMDMDRGKKLGDHRKKLYGGQSRIKTNYEGTGARVGGM
jgi:hypothetical protein